MVSHFTIHSMLTINKVIHSLNCLCCEVTAYTFYTTRLGIDGRAWFEVAVMPYLADTSVSGPIITMVEMDGILSFPLPLDVTEFMATQFLMVGFIPLCIYVSPIWFNN